MFIPISDELTIVECENNYDIIYLLMPMSACVIIMTELINFNCWEVMKLYDLIENKSQCLVIMNHADSFYSCVYNDEYRYIMYNKISSLNVSEVPELTNEEKDYIVQRTSEIFWKRVSEFNALFKNNLIAMLSINQQSQTFSKLMELYIIHNKKQLYIIIFDI